MPPRVGVGTCGSSDRRSLLPVDRAPRSSAEWCLPVAAPSESRLTIVKAYDVRGVVPDQLDEPIARALGAAFADVVSPSAADRIVIAHDMRESGPALARAFAAARRRAGPTSSRPGWPRPTCSTSPRAASTCRARCSPPATTRPGTTASSCAGPARSRSARTPAWPRSARRRRRRYLADDGAAAARRTEHGAARAIDLLATYAGYLRSLVDLRGIRPLRVVVDAGNGMGGYTVPAVSATRCSPALPLDDRAAVLRARRQLPQPRGQPARPGEPGRPAGGGRRAPAPTSAWPSTATPTAASSSTATATPVSPSAITALVAARELARDPGATIIHNLITSRAVPEIIAEHGGRPVRTRVGHSFIKAEMARTGRSSAASTRRTTTSATSGGPTPACSPRCTCWPRSASRTAPLAELTAQYTRYAASGEINSTVVSTSRPAPRAVRAAFADRTRSTDELDGLTVDLADGAWFNVRPSNTEPLLRLNVEAGDAGGDGRDPRRGARRDPDAG